MTMLRFGPLLAIGGAACLVAWTPEGRPPPPEVGDARPARAARVDDAPTRDREQSAAPAAPSGRACVARRASFGDQAPIPPALACPRQRPPERRGRQGPVRLRQPRRRGARARAPRDRAACADGTRSRPRLRGAGAVGARGRLRPCRSPPPSSQAAILYKKGDVAGLAALAAAANDPAERTALEWASLRADAHPSFASLAAFLEAHPSWPSRGWIRERQEAELAAHPQAPARGRRVFRRRAAAIERGQDRRGARGAGDGPRRGGVANHPRLVARRQFRRPDRERHLARIRRFAHQGRPRLSGRPPVLRRLSRRRRPRRGACRS